MMKEKNKHGRVFKKLREERGYKLKDVAGDIISTRTLTRFEADETSLPISIFEKILENLGVGYLEYLGYYYEAMGEEYKEFTSKMNKYLQSGSSSKLVNECKIELKKKDVDFTVRLDILTYINMVNWTEDLELFEENKKIVKEKIELSNKLVWNEIFGLCSLINLASREEYSVEYIDRIIEECLQNISVENYFTRYLNIAYYDLLTASIAFLSINGYFELAEKRCKDVLKIYKEQPLLLNRIFCQINVFGMLSMIYLRQNKKEGVELANKCLKYYNSFVDINDDSFYKLCRDKVYKRFCELNKTGIDIEF